MTRRRVQNVNNTHLHELRRRTRSTSLSTAALGLSRDGSPLDVSGLLLSPRDASAFRIEGLAAAASEDGAYALTTDASELLDLDGLPGYGTGTLEWILDLTPPAAGFDTGGSGSPEPLQSVTLTFSEPVRPGTVSLDAAEGGGPNCRGRRTILGRFERTLGPPRGRTRALPSPSLCTRRASVRTTRRRSQSFPGFSSRRERVR